MARKIHTSRWCKHALLICLALQGLWAKQSDISENKASVVRQQDRIRIEIGGKLFTQYIFRGLSKPVLFPLLAPDGTRLTRNFPFTVDDPDEEKDHPHHRGLAFSHGDINGANFWAEDNRRGVIVSESVEAFASVGKATIKAENTWIDRRGNEVCRDKTIISAWGVTNGRMLDYQVTLVAPNEHDVVIADTLEGTIAIRVAEWMRVSRKFWKFRVPGKGSIINAQGHRNRDAWGRRSEWVDYSAQNGDRTYGIAMMDHPTNMRHPTWWHVQDYGLFAANPFGQHDFEPQHRSNSRIGEVILAKGTSISLRYRLYFHYGDSDVARVSEEYHAFALSKIEERVNN